MSRAAGGLRRGYAGARASWSRSVAAARRSAVAGTFGEPGVERRYQVVGFVAPAALAPQAGETDRGAQLRQARLLAARDRHGALQAVDRPRPDRHWRGAARPRPDRHGPRSRGRRSPRSRAWLRRAPPVPPRSSPRDAAHVGPEREGIGQIERALGRAVGGEAGAQLVAPRAPWPDSTSAQPRKILPSACQNGSPCSSAKLIRASACRRTAWASRASWWNRQSWCSACAMVRTWPSSRARASAFAACARRAVRIAQAEQRMGQEIGRQHVGVGGVADREIGPLCRLVAGERLLGVRARRRPDRRRRTGCWRAPDGR